MRTYTIEMFADGSDEMMGAAVASEYYGGMMSALYALASTGSLELYPGEGLGRIIRELRLVLRDMEQVMSDPEFEYGEDYDPLRALLKWCEREHERTLELCGVCATNEATHFPTVGWYGAVSQYCCNCWECDCETV